MINKISPLRLLQNVPLFADLDSTLLEMLVQHSRVREFMANSALFYQGDPGHSLYVIIKGRIHIQKVTASGEIIHLATRGVGEHLGELALLDGKPRMADAITAEHSSLLILDRADFLRCLEASPCLVVAIMASLADRLRQAADHLESRQELNVLGRVSQLLLDHMATHGHEQVDGGIRLQVRLTHQDLARQIGTTRESVSRAISYLRETNVGALRSEGRILIILSPDKLRQYATL